MFRCEDKAASREIRKQIVVSMTGKGTELPGFIGDLIMPISLSGGKEQAVRSVDIFYLL